MIEVTLTEYSDNFYVKVIGHSGNKGHSIVCASVSVLIETWRLTEQALENIIIPFGEGVIEGFVPKTNTAQILFTQLLIGLQAVQKQYPMDITLNIGGF
ncbi:MAG: ribosomal-processing cysteine protease Prp [Brevinema sp.]